MPIKRKLLIAMIINVSLNKQRNKNKGRVKSVALCKTARQIYLKKKHDVLKSKIKKQKTEIEDQ